MFHQLVKRFSRLYIWMGGQALGIIGVVGAVEAGKIFEIIFEYLVMLTDDFLTDVGVSFSMLFLSRSETRESLIYRLILKSQWHRS